MRLETAEDVVAGAHRNRCTQPPVKHGRLLGAGGARPARGMVSRYRRDTTVVQCPDSSPLASHMPGGDLLG